MIKYNEEDIITILKFVEHCGTNGSYKMDDFKNLDIKVGNTKLLSGKDKDLHSSFFGNDEYFIIEFYHTKDTNGGLVYSNGYSHHTTRVFKQGDVTNFFRNKKLDIILSK